MNMPLLRLLAATTLIVIASPRSANANAPAGHYVVTAGSEAGNGTVYDTKSKLTWQQTAPSAMLTWEEAKTYCESAAVSQSLGGTGWRLPTIRELRSLVDRLQTAAPAIDRIAFPSTPSTLFWSSSPLADSSSLAWCVYFGDGSSDSTGLPNKLHVRCVR